MKETKDLLTLIDDENAIEILCEDHLLDELNILHEYELTDIKGSTVVLTEKGKQAKKKGWVSILSADSKVNRITKKPAPPKTSKSGAISVWCSC